MQLKEFITAPKADAIIPSGVFGKPSVCGASYFTPMYIYIITHPMFNGWIKVGKTFNPSKRLRGYQTHCPDRLFKLEYYVKTNYAYSIETHFNNFIKGNGFEWYEISVINGISEVKKAISMLNKNPQYLCGIKHDVNIQYVRKYNQTTSKYKYYVDGKIFYYNRTLAKYIGVGTDYVSHKTYKNKEIMTSFVINGFKIIRYLNEKNNIINFSVLDCADTN